MNEQIRHLENLKASMGNLYRSSKVAFSYYVLGFSITLIGYFINTMTLKNLESIAFQMTLLFLSISIISGLISIHKDVKLKLNEYHRINALLEQNREYFESAKSQFYKIDKWERIYNKVSIYFLLLSLLSCFIWKLHSIGYTIDV